MPDILSKKQPSTRVRYFRSSSSITTYPINEDSKAWYVLVLLYIIFDYGRPQDILPIGFIRPNMLIVLSLIGFLILSRNLRFTDNIQIRLIWYFIFLLALYVPFAKNNFYAFEVTKTMALYMPFILSLVLCVSSVDRLRRLVFVLVLVLVYVSLYSIIHGGMGSGGWLHDENDVSLYINVWLPFCYFLLFYEKRFIYKIIYFAALIIGVFAIINSFSRGGFVGLTCMFFAAWIVGTRKVFSLVMLLLIASVLIMSIDNEYWREMSTITQTETGTNEERILTWTASWDMFLDNPLGVGGNNFPVHFPEYQSPEFSRLMGGRYAHSLWFTLIPELGVVGILLYVSLLFYNLRDILRLKKEPIKLSRESQYVHYLKLSFFVSFAGFFSSATFLSVLYYPHYWYLTALLVATVRINNQLATSDLSHKLSTIIDKKSVG